MAHHSVLTAAAFGLAALLTTACATQQENPNWQYSSKYGEQNSQYAQNSYADQAPVQMASTIPVETASDMSSDQTWNNDQTWDNSPQSNAVTMTSSQTMAGAPVYEAQPMTTGVQSYPQSDIVTDANPREVDMTGDVFIAEDMTGTPGYMATQGELVEYDYSDNLIAVGTDVRPAALPSETRPIGTDALSHQAKMSHQVKTGDTIYSLARTHCTTVADLQSANNLDAQYSIKIGQVLTIPASCRP